MPTWYVFAYTSPRRCRPCGENRSTGRSAARIGDQSWAFFGVFLGFIGLTSLRHLVNSRKQGVLPLDAPSYR